jgi:hypothetical protein
MANREILALSLSAASASANGNDMENTSCRSGVMVVDVTAITAGSATFTLQGKDPHSGKYHTILASAAATTIQTIVMRVDPAMSASANLIAADLIPRTWRVIYTKGTDAVTSATASVLLVE